MRDKANEEKDLMYSFLDKVLNYQYNEFESKMEESIAFNFNHSIIQKPNVQSNINKWSDWKPFNIIRPDKGSGPPRRL